VKRPESHSDHPEAALFLYPGAAFLKPIEAVSHAFSILAFSLSDISVDGIREGFGMSRKG
jgi:hypothetical protein